MSVHLILGGGGFIGRHVGVELASRGNRVRLAGRGGASAIQKYLNKDLTYEFFDFGSADWDHFLDGVDVVHHYAWSSTPELANNDPVGDLETNVKNTLILLEAMRRRHACRLVFLSSGGTVYGRPAEIPVPEEHKLEPISLYGVAKMAAEQYIGVYKKAHGIDCRIARLSNPFGIGQNLQRNQGAVSTFIRRAMSNSPIHIYGNGEVVRDYLHISDLVRGLISLAEVPLAPSASITYNLASGYGTSLNQIVATLEEVLGRKCDVEYYPNRPYDVSINVLSVKRARQELTWHPRLSFTEGVNRVVEDHRSGATALSTLG